MPGDRTATRDVRQRRNLQKPQAQGTDSKHDQLIDSSAKGIILKSPDGHYWRGTIDNAGLVTWADLGTSKPSLQ